MYSQKRIKKIHKAIDKNKTVYQISKHYGWDIKKVQDVYDKYLYERIANSPRVIIAKSIAELEKSIKKALGKYNSTRHSQDAFAVTSLMSEMRSAMSDLQSLLDINTLASQFVEEVLQKSITYSVKAFVEEVNGVRGELNNTLDPVNFRMVNNALLSCMELLKGKLNPLYLESLERMEKLFSIKLDEQKKLVLIPRKEKKLGILKTGTN